MWHALKDKLRSKGPKLEIKAIRAYNTEGWALSLPSMESMQPVDKPQTQEALQKQCKILTAVQSNIKETCQWLYCWMFPFKSFL